MIEILMSSILFTILVVGGGQAPPAKSVLQVLHIMYTKVGTRDMIIVYRQMHHYYISSLLRLTKPGLGPFRIQILVEYMVLCISHLVSV